MADDITLPGTGAVVAADNISSVLHQRVKVEYGADGSATDVSAASPLPTRPGIATTPLLTRVAINASASGDNTIVSGTGGQTIKVYGFWLWAASPVSWKLKDGASTDFHPACSAQGREELSTGEPWRVTADGNSLILNLSAAVAVVGELWYVKG